MTPHIAPPRADSSKVAFSTSMTEEANGKLVINNDCEYCPCAGKCLALLVALVELALPDDPLVAEQFQRRPRRRHEVPRPNDADHGAGRGATVA